MGAILILGVGCQNMI